MDPKRIATETLAAFETGSYLSPEGGNVELSALLSECLEGTREYQSEQLAALLSRLPHRLSQRCKEPHDSQRAGSIRELSS